MVSATVRVATVAAASPQHRVVGVAPRDRIGMKLRTRPQLPWAPVLSGRRISRNYGLAPVVLGLTMLATACAPALTTSTTTAVATSTATSPTTEVPTTTVASTSPAATNGEASTATTTVTPQRLVILPDTTIWTFPGPDHYEGDVFSFEVPLPDENFVVESATLRVDGVEIDADPIVGRDQFLGSRLIFVDAFDTNDEPGDLLVHVEAKMLRGLEIDVRQRVIVAPAEDRPTQEVGTGWATVASDCCDVTYLEQSAAARDLPDVLAVIQESAAEVESRVGLSLPRVQIVLIDVLWANGGLFTESEVVVSYLDRNYSPARGESFRQTVLHELTHAITRPIQFSTPPPLVEGVAVQFNGGHTKPEPLGARARALMDIGELPRVAELFNTFGHMQHESRYAAVGAFTQYMVGTYGREAVLDLYSFPQSRGGSGWLNAAARARLDTDVEALDAGFADWVAVHEAGLQAEDLSLSVALQEARRTYQAKYSPYPTFSAYGSIADIGQSAVVMRDALAPSLVAVEALIAYAQDLIIAGNLATAAPVVEEIERIAAEGSIGMAISREFLDRAEAVANAGFELIEYVPGSRVATVIATGQAPLLTEVDLELVDGAWRVTASRPLPVDQLSRTTEQAQ